MLEIKRLLRFTPTEAVLMMANRVLNTQLRPEIVQVGNPTVIAGQRTAVTLTALDVQPEMIQNPYQGNMVVEYERYDLNEIFGPLQVDLMAPTTVQEVVRYIQRYTGVVFDADDFGNVRIDQTEFWIDAAPTSKRWVGQLKVFIAGGSTLPHYDQWLPNKRHAGLVTVRREAIWDKYPVNILDGLVVGKPTMGVWLRQTRHAGLVVSDGPTYGQYLPNRRHGGLVAVGKPSMDRYLPHTRHPGLTLPTPTYHQYLPIRQHAGLVSHEEEP